MCVDQLPLRLSKEEVYGQILQDNDLSVINLQAVP